METEYILPFENGRWSIVFEPSYIRISQSDSISNSSLSSINYNAIQLAFGLKYNHIFSKNTKIYGTIIHAPEFTFNSELNNGTFNKLNIESPNNFFLKDYAVGIGIINKKWGLELRYHFKRQIYTIYIDPYEYGVTYLILGHQF